MDPARYQRIKQLFEEVCAQPTAQRAVYLDRACEGDAALRREVDELLRLDASQSGDALDRAVARTSEEEAAESPRPLQQIGRYRILRVCGIGGMGTVYEAEQQSPHRRVAVKVIQRSTARPDLLRRFRREAEILGRLQHPGIAQIFEAGEFEQDGVTRPFFAMEFVEGPSVLDYAHQHKLDAAARQELFIRICEAVHHAHEQGVVHRDLKPDNILVVEQTGTPTGVAGLGGQPKVLDFGVARLADPDTQLTMATGEGQLIGSLPYMSPEQASGRAHAVGARSDVYALGVVLFELLTGRLPYEVRGKALVDAVAVIRDAEPTRLGTVDTGLRGDVETIVGKCLEKDPARRYASALELADDLRRHRQSLPIRARPPSAWYQVSKFARRHRALVGGASATLLALVLGLVVAVVFAVRATDNERRALREAYRSNLAAANALIDTDPLAARRTLDVVPAGQRGWEWRYLDSRLRPHLLDFGEVFAGSPLVPLDEGRLLLAGRDARRLCLWDLETGSERATWTAPGDVSAWGIAADGTRIAAGLADGSVLVAAREPGAEWQNWLQLEEPAVQLVFTPDAERLAVVQPRLLRLGAPGHGWLQTELPESFGKTTRAAFDPTGRRLVLVAESSASVPVRLLDAADLSVLATRQESEAPLVAMFAPDGSRLWLGTVQRTLRLHDPETLQPRDVWIGHTRPIVDVVSDAAGRVLSAARDDTVRVWDERGRCTAVLPHPGVLRAAFVPPNRIVSANRERLRLWDLDGEARHVLRGHGSYVYEVAFSGDGARLVSQAPFAPRELLVWESFTGRLLTRQPSAGGRAAGLTFDGDGHITHGWGEALLVQPWFAPGQRVAAGTAAVTHGWSYDDKQVYTRTARASWPHPETVRCYRTEYGARSDGTSVRLFAAGKPIEVEQVEGQAPPVPGEHPRLLVGNLGFDYPTMDGWITDLVVFGDWLGDADVRAVESYLAQRRAGADVTLPPVASAPLLAHFRADARSVRSTPVDAGAEMAVMSWTARNDSSLVLRRVGFPLRVIRYQPADGDGPERVVINNENTDQSWLETALPSARGRQRTTVFWLGRHSGAWTARNSVVYALRSFPADGGYWRDPRVRRLGLARSLSADGRLLAIGSIKYPRTAQLRDAKTGELLAEYGARDYAEGYVGVALHPDGHLLACGSAAGRLDLWNTETHRKCATVDAHVGQVYCVDWSPDGSRIVTGGNDNSIRLWDAETLEPLLELRGHQLYVKAVAFSPDGSMLASASGDGTVRLWDTVPAAQRYQRVLELRRLQDEVRPHVEGWIAELSDPEAVASAIRAAFSDDVERRQAALTVLALALR